MAAALALQFKDVTRRREYRIIKVTLSSNYTTGGETLDFTGLTNPNNLEKPKFSRKPTGFSVMNFTTGYAAEVVPGTLLTNWKLKITDDTSAGAELAQAGYPVALSGDANIRLEFSGPQGL